MTRNNPPQRCAVVGDLLAPQDQVQDIAMADAAGDSAPHGGQDQDGHPDQELPPKLEALGPGNQAGQQPEGPANMNEMQEDVPHNVIERQEYKCLLHRIGFFLDVAHAKACNHGFDMAKNLSHLKPDDMDILCKTLCSPGGE